MASMASMAQGGTDVEVLLVLGGDEWRRMVASVGDWGALTQRALTWRSLCVLSGEGGTHWRRWVFSS